MPIILLTRPRAEATRVKSLDRKQAAKRGSRYDEEPRPKHFIFENANMEEDFSIDVDSLALKKEAHLVLYHFVLGMI